MAIQVTENARMALTTVREHKVRSALTILGVVIGITTLVAVVSILVGLERDMRGFLEQFGTDTLFVFKFEPGIHFGRLSSEERMRKSLTIEDALAVREECSAVMNVTAEAYPRFNFSGPRTSPTARYQGHEVYNIDHSGTLPSFEQVYHIAMLRGRFFNEAENLHKADVVVIGYDIADTFFGSSDPLGKTILVDNIPYTVIGVEDKRKGNFFKDQSADREAKVPIYSYLKHHPLNDEIFMGVAAYPGQKALAEDQVREVLRRRRRVPFDKPDNFGISSAEQITQQFNQIMGAIALLVVAIASVGLLIGGVGVMNIMLMSVTERTREIGVRKAIGARRSDVIGQFLIEAITLTGLGGVIAVLLVFAITWVVNTFVPGLPMEVPVWGVILGVVTSMTVGLFFGIYPAMRASRLDPVEALRYE